VKSEGHGGGTEEKEGIGDRKEVGVFFPPKLTAEVFHLFPEQDDEDEVIGARENR